MPRVAIDVLCIAVVAVLSLGGLLPAVLALVGTLVLLHLLRHQVRAANPGSALARLAWTDYLAIAVLGPVAGFALGTLMFALGPGL